MAGKLIIYWDSCAFIAYLKGESVHGEDALHALSSHATAFDRGEIILVTSTVGLAEVRCGKLSDEAQGRFDEMCARRNFRIQDMNEVVADLASRIRNECCLSLKRTANTQELRAQTPKSKRILGMADAIHVATAVLCDAAVLVTLDRNEKPAQELREIGMTCVVEHVAQKTLKNLRIELPALGLPGTSLF